MGEVENSEIPCTPWTTRMPKYAQPDLNYIGKPNALFFQNPTSNDIILVSTYINQKSPRPP